MMMIALNSLVRQKEGAQREEEGEAEGPIRTPITTRMLPRVQLSQRCRMRGTGENIDGGVWFHSTGGAEGARD